MRSRLSVSLGWILLVAAPAVAQMKEDAPEGMTPERTVTLAEYRGHLQSLKDLVEACKKDSAACEAKRVGDDERVEGMGFRTRWAWVRVALSSAHNAAQPDREKLLQEAAARLAEDVTLADGTALQPEVAFPHARAKTDEVLSRPEFRTVAQQSYVEREIAKFWQWVNEVFGGVSRIGKRAPWLVPLMEWGSITLAAAGLLAWMLRTVQRQRLAVRIESTASAEMWQKESDDWAELAQAEAVRQDWRAAVHCLYWATIVMMEGRRLWRQNRARTPREYLLLLEPGSRAEQGLQRLTQIFERIWYGLRPAGETDYASALVLFEELRSS
jgi:Domain of unknown function (DUF4129)